MPAQRDIVLDEHRVVSEDNPVGMSIFAYHDLIHHDGVARSLFTRNGGRSPSHSELTPDVLVLVSSSTDTAIES